jgi:hypothetical protein
MFPAITTTHAVPRRACADGVMAEKTTVRCYHCMALLGVASRRKGREELQASHQCSAKNLAKKPSASVPYN